MIGIFIGNSVGKRASPYWTQSKINDSCLFFASHPTDLLSKVVATQLPNQVTGATDYLTVTGSGLNARYRTPNTAAYKTADSDYVFWKTDASESTCDGNRLVGYDFPRILVKYLNVAPYTILAIAILKPGVTVTNGMRDAFDLSVWWDNTLSAHGSQKGNKPIIGQYVWTAESVAPAIPTGLTATLISGGVKWDWTAGDAAAQTEIWCRNDSDAYTTVTYTINAGTVTKSETVNPVDLRYCKIRSLKDGQYSAFTDEVSIAMLSADLLQGDGSFSDKTKWTANQNGNRWTLDNSTAYWGAGDYLAPYLQNNRTINFLTTDKLLIKFNLVTAGTPNILFLKETGAQIRAGFVSANGANTLSFYPSADGSGLGLMSNYDSVTFTLDNLTIQKVLFP